MVLAYANNKRPGKSQPDEPHSAAPVLIGLESFRTERERGGRGGRRRRRGRGCMGEEGAVSKEIGGMSGREDGKDLLQCGALLFACLPRSPTSAERRKHLKDN